MESLIQYLKKLLHNWENSVLDYLPKIFLSVVIVILFFLLAKYLKKIGLKFYLETI